MAIQRKTEQVLTYLERGERERLDARVEEAEVSRAEWVRQAITERLDRDDNADAALEAAGDIVVVEPLPIQRAVLNSLG
jgi:metal-responsive CopG/Arc/MetJ family transcriptional regulator